MLKFLYFRSRCSLHCCPILYQHGVATLKGRLSHMLYSCKHLGLWRGISYRVKVKRTVGFKIFVSHTYHPNEK